MTRSGGTLNYRIAYFLAEGVELCQHACFWEIIGRGNEINLKKLWKKKLKKSNSLAWWVPMAKRLTHKTSVYRVRASLLSIRCPCATRSLITMDRWIFQLGWFLLRSEDIQRTISKSSCYKYRSSLSAGQTGRKSRELDWVETHSRMSKEIWMSQEADTASISSQYRSRKKWKKS